MTGGGAGVLPVLGVRARSLGRALLAIPRSDPVGALFVLAFLVIAGGYLLLGLRTSRGPVVLAAVCAGLQWLVHVGRDDERFLRLAGVDPRRVYAVEYLALALPFSLVLLGDPRPWVPLAGPAVALFLPWLPSGTLRPEARRSERRPLRVPVSPAAFEWIPGLRDNGVAVVALYALSLLLWRIPAAPLVALVLLTWLVSVPWFMEAESWTMVEVFALPPRRFLRDKLRRSLPLFWAACAPLALLVLAREPRAWPAVTLLLLACSILHAGAVLFKYATYHEGRSAPLAGLLTLLVLAAMLAIPPVGLYLLYRLWRQAVRNLEPYLYAFD